MNENEIIQKIVEQRKQRISELGLKADFQNLLFKKCVEYWPNWIKDNNNIVWKEELFSTCNISSIVGFDGSHNKDSKFDSWTRIRFNDETEYRFVIEDWHWGLDNSCKHSNFHFFVNDNEVVEFKLFTHITEWSEKEVDEVISFKDSDWIVKFKEFVKNVKVAEDNYDSLNKKSDADNESKQLKEKFHISDDEVKNFLTKTNTESANTSYELGKNVGKWFKDVIKK